ncbi:MAG: hypothetical protein ABIJ14_01840 [Nanoarchaeota archaeon]
MIAKIISYSNLTIIIDEHLIESAYKKRIPFLKELAKPKQIEFFEKSLKQSEPISSDKVPRNFRREKSLRGKSFKIDIQRGLIYLVYESIHNKTLRAISVDYLDNYRKRFPLSEVANIKGSLVDLFA